jgi:hypothetical protein
MTHKNIPQTRKKKRLMQLHKIRQCCKQFSWPNSRHAVLQFSGEFCFDTKTLRKQTINVEKNF